MQWLLMARVQLPKLFLLHVPGLTTSLVTSCWYDRFRKDEYDSKQDALLLSTDLTDK